MEEKQTQKGGSQSAGAPGYALTPLTGKWITRCSVCGKEYENGCGSTECCGSVQEIVWTDPRADNGIPAKILRAAQRDAENLGAILQAHNGADERPAPAQPSVNTEDEKNG